MSRRGLVKVDWYQVRRARSNKPVHYTCPFCPRKLPAFSEHVLIRPLGQGEGRRHAHTACVLRAREKGWLPSREEWLRERHSYGWLSRSLRGVLRRLRHGSAR